MAAKAYILAPLLMLAGLPAQAQTSGCVRDASGALSCSVQRPAAALPMPSVRPIPRADLAAEAWRRSNRISEQRREALEQQRRDADEQRAKLRQDCLDRTAATGKTAGCSL